MSNATTKILRPGPLELSSHKAIPLRIYVPTVGFDGTALRTEDIRNWKHSAQKIACDAGGGCTTTRGIGSWVTPSGYVVRETVHIVETLLSEPLDSEQQADILRFLQNLCAALFQECVAFEYNGRIGFVEPD